MPIDKAGREAAAKARKDKADAYAEEIGFRLMKLRKERSPEEIARLFNDQKVSTPTGKGKWSRSTVSRVIERLKAMEEARQEAPRSPEAEEVQRQLNDHARQKESFEGSIDADWLKYDRYKRNGGKPVKRPSIARFSEWPTDEEVKSGQAAHEEFERNRTPEDLRAINERLDWERNEKRKSDVWWNKYEKRHYVKRPLTYEEWRIVDTELEESGWRRRVVKGGPAWTLLHARVPKP